MKFSYLTILLFLFGQYGISQSKIEREHRILKSQFPSIDLATIPLGGAKNIKYYREVDSAKITFTLKFRQKKMRYHIDFDKMGTIQSTGFKVREVDIPTDTYANIHSFLQHSFKTIKIKYIQQCYPGTSEDLIKNTFQNLILPNNIYKVMLRGKKVDKRKDYIVLFDAEGNLKNLTMALPANYDRVLY